MSEWTEGICSDGAAILRDGEQVPITELLRVLNENEQRIAELERELRQREWVFLEDIPPLGDYWFAHRDGRVLRGYISRRSTVKRLKARGVRYYQPLFRPEPPTDTGDT